MFSAADLPDTLSLFPLPGAIVLPRAHLPLQIFEPRYLTMLEDALKTRHRLIGMIQPVDSAQAEVLHAVGCAGRITAFSETGDGRYMITLTGVSRFRITEEQTGFTPYRRADVDWASFSSDLSRHEDDAGVDRDQFLTLLRRFLVTNDLATDWDNLKGAADELLINSLSMLLPFEMEDKQALLEAPTLRIRQKTLTTLMEFSLHRGDNRETMQ